jgi:uncharacterized protein YndB with AHSA1/START domain
MGEKVRTSIEIAADPATVYAHFVEPERLVRWMGDRARLVARAGGEFAVDINGVIIRGHFVRLEPPHVIEIAWGEAGNDAMPPGSTRLSIHLTATATGTRLDLEHAGLSADEAKKHALGWPHFLDRLAILARGADPGPDPWRTTPPTPASR